MSFVDTQEMHGVNMPSHPEMCIARDIHVDACSIWLAPLASVALAVGGLMYKMLISRTNITTAMGAFSIGVFNFMMIDVGIVHGGDMQVLHTYL